MASLRHCFAGVRGLALILLLVILGRGVARCDNLLVSTGSNTIRKFSLTGQDLGIFASTEGSPDGLALDRFGNVYVAEDSTNDIRKFSPTGQDLGIFAWVKEPIGVVFDSVGNLFVSSIFDNTIRKFSSTGQDLGICASLLGSGCRIGLAFDRSGNLLVADECASLVRKFSPTGQNLGVFASTGLTAPGDLVFNTTGDLLVANTDNPGQFRNTIREFSPTGEDLGAFASTGLHFPAGLAFDQSGNLYVANNEQTPGRIDYSIRKFSPTGEDLGDFAVLSDQPRFLVIAVTPSTQRYAQINLVSDIPGLAAFTDKKLKNPWGIAFGPTSPFWIADNGTGLSTLYAKDGSPIPQLPSVRIPPPHGSSATATPTGMVFNPTTDFVVSANGNSGPAIFLFATEDGTISGWNPTVALRRAVLAVDNSKIGAVYKGLAFGHTSQGNFIYATNFHDGSVEMYDTNFQLVKTFTDIGLPPGYAPFGMRTIAGKLYVTFAKQDADKHDDVPGSGHGFVDVFNFQGRMLQRLVSRNRLNSPWGVALAPANFGGFSGTLLVGNFGDGKINAFDPKSGAFLGVLRDLQGHILAIDGLWTITFGNGDSTGPRNALFFSAGPNHEADGLFGVLTLIP